MRKKFKYIIGDERFKKKSFAIKRRTLLNKDIKKAGDINLINRVLKTPSGYIVRAKSKRKKK